jgi:NADH-quinone oxidoreductase subunit C
MPEEDKPEVKPAPPAPAAAPKPPAKPPAPKVPATMAVSPWEGEIPAMLGPRFGDRISEFSTYLGQQFLVAKPEAVVPILEFLKQAGFDYLVDVTAADYPQRPERFELIYVLYSFARNERMRVKAQVADGFKPQTATGVHLTANWLEREVFDMFGIEFSGHPDMRRILLPEDWEGYPLRKDKSILDSDKKWIEEHLGIEQ